MLANSYLILSPSEPTDIASAVSTQRQSIPFAWALAVAPHTTKLESRKGLHYFAVQIGASLALIDRALAGWNYNNYFRDTLAPVGVFRNWLANFPSDTWLYVNITELIARSATPKDDIAELRHLPEKMDRAINAIEEKDFTNFLIELRKLSFPFVTVPITGDRERDVQILTFEIRDTSSVEDEVALQIVGVDRDKAVLNAASKSVKLRKKKGQPVAYNEVEAPKRVTLFTREFDQARAIFSDQLNTKILQEFPGRILLESNGAEMMVVKVEGVE